MRGISTFSAMAVTAAVLLATSTAHAAPDVSPLTCVWDKLPPAEQERLIAGFKVDLSNGFELTFAPADSTPLASPIQDCHLTLSAPQVAALGEGLARHAGARQARLGISDRGEKPESVEIALDKMHQGKREIIGDRLSCPGPHSMVHDWDDAVRKGIRRANLGFRNGAAYPWVSLAMYAVMGQEGAVRRMNGKADACS
jgi:hypothetical protein